MTAEQLAAIEKLRRDSDLARIQYLAAQYLVLRTLFSNGTRVWPAAADYENAVARGRIASAALRAYLDRINVPITPRRSSTERKQLIQRLSANERLWQPEPSDWLKQQGFE